MTPLHPAKTQRELLVKLGIGQFNATQVIPFMMTQPATTDPKSPAILLLVREIQKNLFAMGAPIDNTGYLDQPTAACLTQMFGHEGWINLPWFEIVRAVVTARQNHWSFAAPAVNFDPQPVMMPVGGFDVSSVPGGKLTIAAAAVAAYYLWKKRKR